MTSHEEFTDAEMQRMIDEINDTRMFKARIQPDPPSLCTQNTSPVRSATGVPGGEAARNKRGV